MPLSNKRLLKIASFIKKGERVADIGTDHGYLPIYLRKEGISPAVLACDIKESPLAVAKKNVALSNTDGIDFRLCDGLSGIAAEEVDAIIIAGMGGELICEIIKACPWAKGSRKHFILQPMNSPEAVREFLYKNGYKITAESATTDAGRVYTVLDVLAQEDTEKREEAFFFTGLLDPKKEDDCLLLQKQYKRLNSCALELERLDNNERFSYYNNAAQFIKKLLEQ